MTISVVLISFLFLLFEWYLYSISLSYYLRKFHLRFIFSLTQVHFFSGFYQPILILILFLLLFSGMRNKAALDPLNSALIAAIFRFINENRAQGLNSFQVFGSSYFVLYVKKQFFILFYYA